MLKIFSRKSANLNNPQDSRNFYRIDSPKIANPSYKNFIALAFVLSAIFSALYALMRVFMVQSNIDGANLLSADFAPMFIMGARLDMRAIAIFTALVVLLGYVMSLCNAVGARERERERERERVARRAEFMRI
ncbi:hypothetical protein ACWIUD_07860 [Helicobacter sp. 23-1044]